MIKETKKAPTIRFRGFTDDWEQRKLSTLFEKFDDGDWIEAKNQSSAGFRLVQIGNVGVTEYIDKPDNKKWVSEDTFNKLHCEEIFPGDILISRLPEPAGRACIVPETGTRMITAVDCTIARTTAENSRDFLVQCLATPGYFKWVNTCLAGGTRQRISKSALANYEIMVPTIEEQTSIGVYFKTIDHLITLHQRKLNQLKTLKKYFLQNMFPAKGEKVPRIRFKGFTGDWEQRKVGEFYDFKNGLNKNKEFFGTGVPIVNFTDVFHNRGLTASQLEGRVTLEPNEIKNYSVEKGDIFFTRTSETIEEIGYPSVMLDTPENTVFSGFVLRGRCFSGNDPLDNLFKQYVFFTQSFRDEMKKKSSMTTRALTSGTSIKEMLFQFPSSKNEQHQIGKCITKFDDLITLHQRKLDQLQTMKKFMLQNMFI